MDMKLDGGGGGGGRALCLLVVVVEEGEHLHCAEGSGG